MSLTGYWLSLPLRIGADLTRALNLNFKREDFRHLVIAVEPSLPAMIDIGSTPHLSWFVAESLLNLVC